MAERTSPGRHYAVAGLGSISGLLRVRTYTYHCKTAETRTISKTELTTQLYGISFLSLAVCDGAEYAVNDK
jgi:hypothetical protein